MDGFESEGRKAAKFVISRNSLFMARQVIHRIG